MEAAFQCAQNITTTNVNMTTISYLGFLCLECGEEIFVEAAFHCAQNITMVNITTTNMTVTNISYLGSLCLECGEEVVMEAASPVLGAAGYQTPPRRRQEAQHMGQVYAAYVILSNCHAVLRITHVGLVNMRFRHGNAANVSLGNCHALLCILRYVGLGYMHFQHCKRLT